ncbi:hypothetical protein NR798_47160 [Archangium gephyra]|uniref:HORMA-1 domain-containing protein n=1 Tax=Archangium gephyra TaxID=48 RepID=UPI0035D50CD2
MSHNPRADVARTFESFRSVLRLIAHTTGLNTATCEQTADDVTALAQEGFLKAVDILLLDEAGHKLCAASFAVSEEASGRTHLPGDNIWPHTPRGQLVTVITYSSIWMELPPEEKQQFKNTLKTTWNPTHLDTDHSSMDEVGARLYGSNRYGLQQRVYIADPGSYDEDEDEDEDDHYDDDEDEEE